MGRLTESGRKFLFFLSLGLCCLLAWSISCRNSVYLAAKQHRHVSFKHEHFTGSWDNSEFITLLETLQCLSVSEADTSTIASSSLTFKMLGLIQRGRTTIVHASLCSYCRLIIAEITLLLIGHTLIGQLAKIRKRAGCIFTATLVDRCISRSRHRSAY